MQYNRRVRRVKQMIGAVEDDVHRLGRAAARALLRRGEPRSEHRGHRLERLQLPGVPRPEAPVRRRGHRHRPSRASCNYPPTSTQALFVRRALLAWADDAKLLSTDGGLSDDQKSFLRTFDLGYGHRRLAFVIGRLGHYYEAGADRELLNTLKHRLYELVSELQTVLDRTRRRVPARLGRPDLRRAAAPPSSRGLGGQRVPRRRQGEIDGAPCRARHVSRARRSTGSASARTATSSASPRSLPAEIRYDLRLRYLGFPYWDATTYPVRMLSDVAELDEVKVVRVSPLDTHLLTNGNAAHASAKLHGVSLGHFGAFFKRSWRENDYLWGRLDGAERLLWLIGEPDDAAAKEAFAAIVAEEAPKLRKAGGLIRRVREYVGGGPVEAPLAADQRAYANVDQGRGRYDMAVKTIPFVQAKNFTQGPSNAIDVLVIHTMESPEKPDTAESVAHWFAGSTAPQASAHYCIDDNSIVQCVHDADVAWHAPGANHNGLGFEHAGRAAQTQGRLERRVLDEAARALGAARRGEVHGVSHPRRLAPRPPTFAPASAASRATCRCRMRSSGRITATPARSSRSRRISRSCARRWASRTSRSTRIALARRQPEQNPTLEEGAKGYPGEAAPAPAQGPPLRSRRGRRHLRAGDEEGGREGAEGARSQRERDRGRHDLACADRVGDEDLVACASAALKTPEARPHSRPGRGSMFTSSL